MKKFHSKKFQEEFSTFENSLREKMKHLLSQCSPEQQNVFRLMYNPFNKYACPVDGISYEKMDWAFFQLEQTLCPTKKVERYLNGQENQ